MELELETLLEHLKTDDVEQIGPCLETEIHRQKEKFTKREREKRDPESKSGLKQSSDRGPN